MKKNKEFENKYLNDSDQINIKKTRLVNDGGKEKERKIMHSFAEAILNVVY